MSFTYTSQPAKFTRHQVNERVKVKVLNIQGHRIGLSLKDVDQRTGQDMSASGAPPPGVLTGANAVNQPGRNPEKPKGGAPTGFEATHMPTLDDLGDGAGKVSVCNKLAL